MGLEFSYKPSKDYSKIDPITSFHIAQKELELFREGYNSITEPHLISAEIIRKHLNAPKLVLEIRKYYEKNYREVNSLLNDILKIARDLSLELEKTNLRSTAKRDYHNFFSSTLEENELDFLQMLKAYEYIKYNNTALFQKWNELKNLFEGLQVTSLTRPFLEKILHYNIYPKLELIEKTDLLLKRMKYILKVDNLEQKYNKVVAQGKYKRTIRYDFNSIFNEEINAFLLETHGIEDEYYLEKRIKNPRVFRESCIKNDFAVDTRGNEFFNQSSLYTLNIKADKLELEKEKIRKAFYIEKHLGSEQKLFKQDMIHQLSSKNLKKDRIAEYDKFLEDYLDTLQNSILMHFADFNEKEHYIIMYHFGPAYFLKFILYYMRKARTGAIHRKTQGNEIIRELPFEYLKLKIGHWWDIKVFKNIDPVDRNSKEIYDKIIQFTSSLWQIDQPKVLSKIVYSADLQRAFNSHDVGYLKNFLSSNVSYFFYLFYTRFLGTNFIYIPVHKKNVSTL